MSTYSQPSGKMSNGHARIRSAIKKAMAPPNYLNPSYTSFDEEQGARDYQIQRNIQDMNFRGLTVTQVHNKLVTPNLRQKRDEYFTQLRMEWNNQFMVVPAQAERLNNPMQESFNKQRQLTVPNAYGQFYAFMHALSAAFGTLQG